MWLSQLRENGIQTPTWKQETAFSELKGTRGHLATQFP